MEGGGGEFFHSEGLVERHYTYSGSAPWPSTIQEKEAGPEGGLLDTVLHTIQRDSLGRPVRDTGSDGSVMITRYDRTGGAIGWETGAGTSWGVSLDSAGKVVRELRPSGRGESRFGYDLDGRLLVEERTYSGGSWKTQNTYDGSGRLLSVIHPDSTQESWTYAPDDVPLTWTTRDGVTLTYGYDDANRVTSVTPSAASEVSVRLDGGDSFAYDPLSRLLSAQRATPDQRVRYQDWDLGGRPAQEIVGNREPLKHTYDVFDNPLQTQLPGGSLQSAGGVAGWSRTFDTLDRVTTVGPLGSGAQASGAAWTWGGAARLYQMTTVGGRGSQVRFGYHSGPGPASSATPAPWQLGALEWGKSGGPSWGQFETGWRQNDGAKVSRPTVGSPFAGLDWSYGYDAGVRLTSAGGNLDSWSFGYGQGDERTTEQREQTGELTPFGTGANGRITTRGGVGYTYDLSGRRTQDDRFSYVWDWRGQLVEVNVKESWPDEDGDGEADRSPFAGHRVLYNYDAAERLLSREHRGVKPAGGTDADRPFVDSREYIWDGETLSTEVSWTSPDRTAARWRKTYVPGANGLDDSAQVLVEIAGQTHLYTYLRDEMGTVVGIVAEEEAPPTESKPAAPVRYLYTPYGEAHVESGPELRRAHFDSSLTTANGIEQTVGDLHAATPGAMVLDWSLQIEAASVAHNLIIEKLESGTGWVELGLSDAVVAAEEAEGELGRVVAMPISGWQASTSYRVRIKPDLRDILDRPFGRTESLEFRVPDPPAEASAPVEPPVFDKKIPVRYASWAAAWNDVGGRFPGGQNALFQGLYTDNVTGLSYARARWYDARNAAWLSEDPMGNADSPSLYAFVAYAPTMGTDPLGLLCVT
ncbi:MAG TPA: RHS repeat-associated core domain-containing protein, partial [Thermoanaerobaculia bacterium]|nr:RHS repeat-associated core domain-containing protein [Thermoanaerobaculia bacterium]